MDCLAGISDSQIQDSTIYVFREDSKGNPRMSRPCDQCLFVLKALGVKRILYTTSEYPFYGEERI